VHPRRHRHTGTRRNPMLVGLEPDAEPVVKDAQCTIAITHHRLRHDSLHFLRHHADIGTVAAVVAEAIIAEAIGKMTEQDDIVLERDVGPSASTATTTSSTTTTTAATAATEAATTTAATEATAATAATETTASDTRATARGRPMSDPARSNISQSVAASSA
jgi:hypothetical protein